MPVSDIQDWLLANAGFRRLYGDLLKQSVGQQFDALVREQTPAEGRRNWQYLLMCAGLLASSERSDAQDAALRIAQSCITFADTTEIEREAAGIVFDTLANRLALELAEKREKIRPGIASRLGVASRIEWTRRGLENSIDLSNGNSLSTNRFQKRFWNLVQESSWTSASAPTSAGKSYIILQWIADFFRGKPTGTIIYLVPTRALIHQVETDFRELRRVSHLSSVFVTSLPMSSALRPTQGNFLVFTQERFHLFLSAFEHMPPIDVIIVDEAQKVGDRQRGVLLQDVIERVAAAQPNVKVIFASPQSENPEVLLADAPVEVSTNAVVSGDVTVNQNLIWAAQTRGNPKKWEISLCLPETIDPIGTVNLPFSPTTIGKRLPFVAHALAPIDGGSLIYVDGAADAEKAAELLFDLMGREADPPHIDPLTELSELIKAAVHGRYSLARVVTRRIAFHYGNIPLLVRNEVERAFREGHLKYLVCTSTLVEGVNLPCRNIFLRGPKKGKNQPMNEADFWNLAGRAGRWGREFQGNVVCVDAKNEYVWKLGAPRARARYRIERSTDRVLSAPAGLIEFIRSGTPRDNYNATQELEYITSYLFANMLRGGNLAHTPLARRLSRETIGELEGVIQPILATLTFPPDVIWRNPGISPIAMHRLFKYFEAREGAIDDLLPVAPSSEDASSQYIAILARISRELAPVFGLGPRPVMLGMLITNWMRGHPLKRLIDERIDYLTRKGRPFKVAAVIRRVMADVEEIARFQAPKFLSCYIDVLRAYLISIGKPELLPAELDLNVLLEFGVPGGTQLSLMGLGLSRTSALALAEIIAADTLTEDQCIEWLRSNSWDERDLPTLVKREIRIALDLNSPPIVQPS